MKMLKYALVITAGLLLPFSASFAGWHAQSDWGKVTVSGWARAYMSMNLEDPFPAGNHDNRWDFSMIRGSLQLYADGKIANKVGFHVIGRLTREFETSYLERLDEHGANLQHGKLAYERYKQTDLREFYIDIPLEMFGLPVGAGSELRLGKQQVAFGNTDFFHVLDAVEGFDYTWRSFLDPANEEIRKPLIMANL